MNKYITFLILTAYSLYPNIIFAGDVSDVQNRVFKIQSEVPSGTPTIANYDQKGYMGTILEKIFDPVGQIKNIFIIAFQNIEGNFSGNIPKWDGYKFVESNLSYSGAGLELGGDINVLGDIYQNGNLLSYSGGSVSSEGFTAGIIPGTVYNMGSVGIGIDNPGDENVGDSLLYIKNAATPERGTGVYGSSWINLGSERDQNGSTGFNFFSDASFSNTTAQLYKGAGKDGNFILDNGIGGDFKIVSRLGGWNNFVVKANGNVGIGTNNPTQKFQVVNRSDRGAASIGSSYVVLGENRTQNGAAGVQFMTDRNERTTVSAEIYKGAGKGGNFILDNKKGGDFIFSTKANFNNLRISDSGVVGIGLANPGSSNSGESLLEIKNIKYPERGISQIGSSWSNFGVGRTSNGAAGFSFSTQANLGTTAEIYKGSGGSGNMIIRNSGGGDVKIGTKYGWNNIVVKQTGRVGIGTNAPTAGLSVRTDANKPGGGPWGTFSDARLKDIQGDYTKGLQEILQISPIQYSYKHGNELGWDSEPSYVGFIAQDVQNIFPDAVTTSSNGYLELNTQEIDMALVNAIKELSMEIELLKQQQK